MMSKITISMDSELKKEAEALFSELGINFSTAVNIFIRRAIRYQGIPFAIKRNHVPNVETLATIEKE